MKEFKLGDYAPGNTEISNFDGSRLKIIRLENSKINTVLVPFASYVDIKKNDWLETCNDVFSIKRITATLTLNKIAEQEMKQTGGCKLIVLYQKPFEGWVFQSEVKLGEGVYWKVAGIMLGWKQ